MTARSDTRRIQECNYDSLPSLKIPTDTSHRRERYSEEENSKIPLLEEVFQKTPLSVCIIIEIKQDSDLLIEKVRKLAVQYHRVDTIFWFSLDEKVNVKLRDVEIPTITSIPGMLRILVLYYTGLLPFFEIPDAVFGITVEEITLDTIRRETALKGTPDWVKRALAFLFRGRPPKLMIAPTLFAHLRRRGIPVWFLGVDSEEEVRLAVKTGATAVLTDRIRWLSECVKENKLKFCNVDN